MEGRPSLAQTAFDPALLIDRAVRCGDWMVANQVTDRFDANRGRSVRSYDARTGEKALTGNWMTGSMLMSLLALSKRTGIDAYRDAAVLAGRYILSLQVMDRHDPYFGAIREITPQSIEFAPRDATSAAWGLAWLGAETGESLYLDRARLFADWLIDRGMYRGWPLYAIYMDDHLEDFYSRGCFQSGAGLFFYDLFRFTGDAKYIERGLLPIASIYRDEFIPEDGRLIQERDPFTGRVTAPKPGDTGLPVHALNDDFGSAMLLAASRFFEEPSYLDAAARYARWVASVQEPDGGYEGGRAPSAVPVSEMYLRDIGEEVGDTALVEAADRSLAKLIDMQFLDTGDSCIDGGFHGMYEGKEADRWGRTCVNMRASSYALIALIKAESDLEDIWLGTHNTPFTDHRWRGLHDLTW